MTVYLIHLDQPLSHARHYIGWTTSPANVKRRLEHHKAGCGARFTQACNERGINYGVVRVWNDAGKDFERHLKNQHKPQAFCPICNPQSAMNNMKGKNDPKNHPL